MIRVINICKRFNDKVILDNISIEVKDKLIAILGLTGVGKSVFLKIVAGLINADSGVVRYGPNEFIGFVFQHSALFDFLTAIDNIRLPLQEVTNLSNQRIQQKVDNIIKLLNIPTELLKRRCNELSGGERKIIAIARAIILEPNYLLYDEPTTGLDEKTHFKICQIIRNLNKPGILVTHDKKAILEIGISECYVLADGKLKSTSVKNI